MSQARRSIVYLAVFGVSVAAFMAIRAFGEHIHATPDATAKGTSTALQPAPDVLLHLLLALAVVILTARLAALLLARINQAPVIGEIIAGIVLGPSLLGHLSPAASAYLFPPNIIPLLGSLSQVGIVLYMFIVGLKFDTLELRTRTTTSIAVSHASIVVPFLMGAGMALWLYPLYSSQDVPFTVFALFIGVSMSVTAFPVLARILADRGLGGTPLGTVALAAAAVGDVTAWCLLALLVGAVRSTPEDALITIGLTGVFMLVMLFVVRPAALLLKNVRDQRGGLSQGMFLLVCVALLGSAVIAEQIGIHALFGAFLLGALIPHDSALARDITAKLEDVVVVLLLPAFFAFAGIRTQLGLVNGWEEIIACVVIIAVASAGKFGGSTLAARMTGESWRQASALGILMNTRGLMELIVLNIGLDLGVLSPTLYTMLVIMALVTTFATTPVLTWLQSTGVTGGRNTSPGRFSSSEG
jgi:Kef-type K+ transport system membrane component KefB